MQQRGILDGYPDGYFYGKRSVTRREAAVALKRFWDKNNASFDGKTNRVASTLMVVFSPSEPDAQVRGQSELFNDTDPIIWNTSTYTDLRELGILNGFPDGNYRDKRSLTRAEFAVLLSRMAQRLKKEPKLDIEKIRFRDVDGDEWYFGPVLIATGTGLMDGYGKGTFHPHQSLTRYELAIGLWRLHRLCTE